MGGIVGSQDVFFNLTAAVSSQVFIGWRYAAVSAGTIPALEPRHSAQTPYCERNMCRLAFTALMSTISIAENLFQTNWRCPLPYYLVPSASMQYGFADWRSASNVGVSEGDFGFPTRKPLLDLVLVL